MRYKVLTFNGQYPHEHEAESLAQAVKILHRENRITDDNDAAAARGMLRWWTSEISHPIGMRAELPDGQWLSLDPEDAQDAVLSAAATAAFEADIIAPPARNASLTYRLRMTSPDDIETITDHVSIQDVFAAIAKTWAFNAPLQKGFTHALLRTEAEMEDFTLSARPESGAGAVPFSLFRAEDALVSHHAAIQLSNALRQDLVRAP